ncbi:hypothetical protein M942_12995 [Enterobacter ludwigii]|nr:hypothetical protein M942_12995 [Enterobacter ludwigii]
MENNICNCRGCGHQHNQAEMKLRKSDIYPYQRQDYYCATCILKREQKEDINKLKARLRKPAKHKTPAHTSQFRW